MPVPAIVLAAIGGPGDDMCYAGRDFVIAAGTAVVLGGSSAGNGTDRVGFIAAGTVLGAAEDVTERARVRLGPRL
ncbi:hypothetical protein GFY24_38535 [Nocardia sp. SYP-A9097]|nr:hypothetical protein [Nocardia sp. SYP-A9097]